MEVFDIVEELEKERKKNKELEELCDKYEEEHKTTFKIWQKDIKENKKLKQQIEYLRSNKYLNQVKWERDYNEKVVEDLSNKIDKATKKIKEIQLNANKYGAEHDVIVCEELLIILRGEDK